MKPGPLNGLVNGPAHSLAGIVGLSALGCNALLPRMELAMGFLQVGDGQMEATLFGCRRAVQEDSGPRKDLMDHTLYLWREYDVQPAPSGSPPLFDGALKNRQIGGSP